MRRLPPRSADTKRANGKPPRVDVAGIRREQIVDAAAAVIADEGIQSLSLSAIEARTGMSRGQLTYYFPAKEDILLAVFDRMVRRMRERVPSAEDLCGQGEGHDSWVMIRHLLGMILGQPAPSDFTSLQYTFLAQVGHREDFRRRLASLYGDWRGHMAAGLDGRLPRRARLRQRSGDARTVASFVQAVLHGLVVQLVADPDAFDRSAMFELCVEIIGRYLGRRPDGGPPNGRRRARRPRPEGNHHG